MERKSFLQIVEYIKEFANAHTAIKKVEFDFYEQIDSVLTKSERYPAFFIVPLPSTLGNNDEGAKLNTFNLDIYCVDIIQKDRENILEIVSDTALLLNDLLLFINDGSDWSFEAEQIGNLEPLNNSLLDYAAGNKMTLAVTVAGYGVCEIPMGEIVPFEKFCEPAVYVIKDQNGNTLASGEIPAGGSEEIPVNVGECDPATAVLKDTGGLVLDSLEIAAGESGDLTAPDASYSIKDTAGAELYGGTVVSGGTLNKTIQDATIKNTDNSVSIGLKAQETKTVPDITATLFNSLGTVLDEQTKPALKDIDLTAPDISFTDSDGNTLTVAAGVDIIASACSLPTYATADVMKTGQTASQVPYDDGYNEFGRLVDFFTLAGNNKFGNTNRFTDTLGGQTYANNIILDHSTYNGTSRLAWYKGNYTTNGATLANACLNAHAATYGGFSAWYVPNKKQKESILYNGVPSGGKLLNYAPFNITLADDFWTCTNTPITPASAVYVYQNYNYCIVTNGNMSYAAGKHIPCRYITDTELGI
jgi:hypothetical protein